MTRNGKAFKWADAAFQRKPRGNPPENPAANFHGRFPLCFTECVRRPMDSNKPEIFFGIPANEMYASKRIIFLREDDYCSNFPIA